MPNVKRIKNHTNNYKTISNIPEVFWLKLMALDTHDDGLMSVNGFPINLKGEKKHFTCKRIYLYIIL